jgi:hypothetical protein
MPIRRKQPTVVYQLKVTLKNSKPPIWRRIQVTCDTPLDKLHLILQTVMGWENYHLHQFKIGPDYYGVEDPEFEFDGENETQFDLSEVVFGVKMKFLYEYDFGDGWEHEIVVEKILQPEAGVHYPVCLTGKRACPPEDCGGIWGYGSLLEAIANPEHPQHDEMVEWLNEDFDPEAFDLQAINWKLRSLK